MAKSSKIKTNAVFNVGDIDEVILIGCGGTGAILAEHLCRMIAGYKLKCDLVIYDGDTVEQNNIKRQNFYPYEIGQNKADAIALRLAGKYGIKISASKMFLRANEFNRILGHNLSRLIITATDTLVSRRMVCEIANTKNWLDVGNELNHGQAVFGTTHDPNVLIKGGRLKRKLLPTIADLPDIAALNPKILTAKKTTAKTSCVDSPFLKQGFAVNEMAALAAAIIAKQILVDRQVKYSGIYFNVSDGRMQPRLIDKSLFEMWR